MRILFVGSKGMGVLALRECVSQGVRPVAVVARWDDPSEGQWYPSVTESAEELGFEVYKPQDINSPEFLHRVRALSPDLIFTAFYPKIYKKDLLLIPSRGSLNLHFAPLPRYRGSYPGAWAIINGETQHGVTIHAMAPGVDNGDIIGQLMVTIDETDTGFTLYEKCEIAGKQLLRSLLPSIIAGSYHAVPQRESEALYHDRWMPYGGIINFTWSARAVYDFVRALTFPPFPNPYAFVNQRKFTVERCRVSPTGHSGGPGTISSLGPDSLRVECGIGAIDLLEFKDNRGREISLEDFVKTYRLRLGTIIGR